VEPVHNLVKGGPGFEVFKDNRNRHPGILKHPRAPLTFPGVRSISPAQSVPPTTTVSAEAQPPGAKSSSGVVQSRK
jgi:hypothetical protein